MTNQSELLKTLKELAEYVEFDVEEWLSDLTHEKLCLFSNSFTLLDDTKYYRIPSVEWLEDKAVEMLPKYWGLEMVMFPHAQTYSIFNTKDKMIEFSQHPDRLTAIASLLLKLCKSKEI